MLLLYVLVERFLEFSEPELSVLLHNALIMVPEALDRK